MADYNLQINHNYLTHDNLQINSAKMLLFTKISLFLHRHFGSPLERWSSVINQVSSQIYEVLAQNGFILDFGHIPGSFIVV